MYNATIEAKERSDFEDWFNANVNSLLSDKPTIRLLEAGCGSATHVRFVNTVEAVGIDISEAQLHRNSSIQKKILGDIQTYAFPSSEFDVAICWDVLEHLPRPHDALVRIFSALKEGGILILGFP